MTRAGRSAIASYRCWVTSPLCRATLVSFLLLWMLAKAMLAAGNAYAALPLQTFRPYAETWACALEVLTLAHFVRRRGEDVLLANLGIGLGSVLVPFAVLHFVLSGALAALPPP